MDAGETGLAALLHAHLPADIPSMSLEVVLGRYGPTVHAFEEDYVLLCAKREQRGRSRPQLLALGAGSFGVVLVAVPRDNQVLSAAVAVKVQWSPGRPDRAPRDAATQFLREYYVVTSRLQPEDGDRDELDPALMLPHPGIVRLLDCYVEEQPTEPEDSNVRIIIISELGLLSPDLRELSHLPLSSDWTAFTTPLAVPDASKVSVPLLTLDVAAAEAAAHAAGVQPLLSRTSLAEARRLQPECGTTASYRCTLSANAHCPLPLTRFQAKAVALQLLLALRAMHARGIYHRDIKPDNVIVTRVLPMRSERGAVVCVPVVKIIDYGFIKPVDLDESTTAVNSRPSGTVVFSAPEVSRAASVGALFDGRVDGFAVGTTVFTLVSDALPNKHGSLGFPERFTRVAGRMRNDDTGAVHSAVVDASMTHFAEGTVAHDWLRAATQLEVPMRATVDELIAHEWLATTRASCVDVFKHYSEPFDVAGMAAAMAAAAASKGARYLNGGSLVMQPPSARAQAELQQQQKLRADARRAQLFKYVTASSIPGARYKDKRDAGGMLSHESSVAGLMPSGASAASTIVAPLTYGTGSIAQPMSICTASGMATEVAASSSSATIGAVGVVSAATVAPPAPREQVAMDLSS